MSKKRQQEMGLRRTLARVGRRGRKVKLPVKMFLEALNFRVYDNAKLNKRVSDRIYVHEIQFVDDYKFITYTPIAITDSENIQEIPGELEGKWEKM